jgi:hypothetical protein
MSKDKDPEKILDDLVSQATGELADKDAVQLAVYSAYFLGAEETRKHLPSPVVSSPSRIPKEFREPFIPIELSGDKCASSREMIPVSSLFGALRVAKTAQAISSLRWAVPIYYRVTEKKTFMYVLRDDMIRCWSTIEMSLGHSTSYAEEKHDARRRTEHPNRRRLRVARKIFTVANTLEEGAVLNKTKLGSLLNLNRGTYPITEILGRYPFQKQETAARGKNPTIITKEDLIKTSLELIKEYEQ